MRIVIVTDSLGMPRKEVKIDDVWTDKILNKLSLSENDVVVYPILKRCLTVGEVYDLRHEIGRLHPDIILFQFGIVDCVRRTIPLWLHKTIFYLPKNARGGIIKFLGRHHYFLTKMYCIRYNNPQKFKNILCQLIDWLEARPRKYAFIRISSLGKSLCEKTYNAASDAELYNDIFRKTVDERSRNGVILDPYVGHDVEEYILEEDGHHLNPMGAELVYRAAYDYVKKQMM